MMSTLTRRPLRPEEDAGFTLIEMIVAMSIFSVLLVIFGTAMTDWTKDVVRTSRVSDQTSTARNVFNLLDKQVPSSAAVNWPEHIGTDWYVEMRNDATTPRTCIQWRLRTTTNQLQWRSWSYNPPAVAATPAWRTVDQIAVVSKTPGGVDIAPFVLAIPDSTYVTQRLTVNVSDKKDNGPITQNRAVFSVRNSSSLTTTNADVNADGRSDSPVCQEIAGVHT